MAQATYQINRPIHEINRKRFKRRLYFALLVLLIFLVILAFFVYKELHYSKQSGKSPVGKSFVQHIQGPQLYKDEYFEFWSSDKWTFDQNDSTNNRRVFLFYQEGIVAGSLYVYINEAPYQADLYVDRAIPVAVKSNSFSDIGNISAPCDTTYTPNEPKIIQTVSIDSTSIICVPGTPQYEIMLGQIGGNYILPMKRSDGQTENYTVIYLSSSFTPNPLPFTQILPTFRSL
jgi:hypothetical protein